MEILASCRSNNLSISIVFICCMFSEENVFNPNLLSTENVFWQKTFSVEYAFLLQRYTLLFNSQNKRRIFL